ncbi:hypothetical protein SAICODRAFT_163476, partial [Saitoella complicata NRRL Y-17804]
VQQYSEIQHAYILRQQTLKNLCSSFFETEPKSHKSPRAPSITITSRIPKKKHPKSVNVKIIQTSRPKPQATHFSSIRLPDQEAAVTATSTSSLPTGPSQVKLPTSNSPRGSQLADSSPTGSKTGTAGSFFVFISCKRSSGPCQTSVHPANASRINLGAIVPLHGGLG